MSWKLPASPGAPIYREIMADIHDAPPEEARIRFRALAESDFWIFIRFALSFGTYLIREAGHRLIGLPWAEHPWVFDRCREIQYDAENSVTDKFYNWPRYSFKTELITKALTIWELLKDPTLTFALLTYKADQIGDAIFENIRAELERNEVLLTHWPDRLAANTNDYELWTNTKATILRPLGPREPSISVHSILSVPTSGHYRRIVVDDAVERRTVENVQTIAKTYSAMKTLTPIQSDDTLTRWVGTIWDQYDPYMLGVKDGLFAERSLWASYLPSGEPILHTDKMLAEWRRKMGEYLFSANMMNHPTAKGDQYFEEDWLKTRYTGNARDERVSKVVYVFGDLSSGTKEGDFTALWVIGLGEDRRYYALDLIRDRLQLGDLLDTLFTIAKRWKPEVTWIEQIGDTAYYSTIKREMEVRHFRFNVRKIGRIGSQRNSRSKEQRIVKLQPMMKRGEIFWPQDGFGHGSLLSGDSRDTFEQFRQDEFRFWTPVRGSTLHDDCLDALSWIAQPEMQTKLRWPETVLPEEALDPHHPVTRHRRHGEFGAVSGWAF